MRHLGAMMSRRYHAIRRFQRPTKRARRESSFEGYATITLQVAKYASAAVVALARHQRAFED